MRRIVTAIVAAFTAIGFLTTMSASAAGAQNVSFFSNGGASAHWAPNHSAIVLSETTTPGAYAGAQLMHVGSSAPENQPTFEDVDSVTEPSGGSPRLVIAFADGGTIYGYALEMSTSQHPGVTQWDSTNPSAYDLPYNAAADLHATSAVVAAYLVTDSGWEGQPYTNTITQVSYGGEDNYAG